MIGAEVERVHSQNLVIEPPRGWARLGLGELWQHRDLLYFLSWRDIKVRYAQASMGIAWAVLQPLLMMVIFTIFLGRLAKVPSDGLPYPVFALSGLVPWTYFANAVTSATESLTGERERGVQGLLPSARWCPSRLSCRGSPTSPSRPCCWWC